MKSRGTSRHLVLCVSVAIALCLLWAASAVRASAQETTEATENSPNPITVQLSPQLFATMCALDAAGFGANSTNLNLSPLETDIQARMLQLKGPAAVAVRQFYSQHQHADPEETLAPYLSFALAVGPPPEFHFMVSHDELPPAVLSIDGFSDVLRDFYSEAQIDHEWAAAEPDMEREADRLTDPFRQIVLQSTVYLRQILTPEQGRTFTVIPSMLVGPRVDFRNVGNHYIVVVGEGSVLPLEDIRHAFLHFLLDPDVLSYQPAISTRRALLSIAARAPQLPYAYQDDFVGLFDECLVRAVELKLRKLAPAPLETLLSANDRTGFILVRPVYEQLAVFEKDQSSMRLYMPDLIRSIKVAQEQKRLQSVQFAPAGERIQSGGIGGEGASANAVGEAVVNNALMRGDRQIALQDASGAAATFQSVLDQHPNLPRALYGLALASLLQNQGQKAEDIFEKLIQPPNSGSKQLPPSPDILAWSHVYLGRMHDVQGDRDGAMNEYRAALVVNGAPEAARAAAQQGIDSPYRPPAGAQKQ
ncbi:MAG TPA: tetratricopeptide repeat protein [Candidatus Acidoferrales bacterium]|nr:tetratricopeptide repeat protein [Candidatus Acidoferrales bacterium]